jgi:hypothetical protein
MASNQDYKLWKAACNQSIPTENNSELIGITIERQEYLNIIEFITYVQRVEESQGRFKKFQIQFMKSKTIAYKIIIHWIELMMNIAVMSQRQTR